MHRAPPDPWSFDFFDDEGDEDAAELAQELVLDPHSGANPPRTQRAQPSQRSVRMLRLGVAAVLFVFFVVLIVSVVGGGDKPAGDRAYLSRLAQPAQDSQAVGLALSRLLSGKPASYGYLETRITALLQRQQQDLAQATGMTPSPTLRDEHLYAIQAFQLRVSGLIGLRIAFRSASAGSAKADWAKLLSAEAERLVASDVIWRDFFQKSARAQTARDGAARAAVPDSRFLSNPDLATAPRMRAVLDRLSPHTASAASTTPDTNTGPLLRAGETGVTVTAWQRALNRWLARQPGQTRLTVTGTFDQSTASATIAFQGAENLSADGIVGAATRAALGRALRGASG